jgi:hypothetical protein
MLPWRRSGRTPSASAGRAKAQKSAAAALMPAIDAEIDARRAAKLDKAKAKAASRRHGQKADAEPESASG